MEDAKPMSKNMNAIPESTKLDIHAVDGDATRYQSIVGSLLYIAIRTRPNLCTAARSLSAHGRRRCQVHFVAGKSSLHYFIRALNLSLMLSPGSLNQISPYVDANWKQESENNWRSRTEVLFRHGNATI